MSRTNRFSSAVGIVIAIAFSLPAGGYEAPKTRTSGTSRSVRVRPSALWRDRGSIGSLNVFYGPGGKAHEPRGKFAFIKEDKGGTSPKFEIVDGKGVHWKAKLGEETKSETAATRLVWAAGYFTNEDYYLPELRVDKMPKLDRGAEYVSEEGVVHGVRLERNLEGEKKSGTWSWFKNPLVGTKELNGLRIMMALINNWDLKEVNNTIYREQGEGLRYVISDLGATFGRTGNPLVRSKSNLHDYRESEFIQRVETDHVDYVLNSRPFFLTVFNAPTYITRTKMQDVVKDIPRAHARWLGRILGRLSVQQIRDCFRAAGYSPEEVEGFTKVVRGRIADLNRL